MQYPIDIFDNHVILIDKDKRLLIDTGAPISISDGSSIDVFNNVYSTKKTYHGANINEIGNYVGCGLNALIGNNILANYVFQIDFNNKLFSIWNSLPEEIINTEDFIKADFQGIPTIDVLVNNDNPITSWLDTGAKISYINKNYVQHLDSMENQKDFFPSYGEFEVPIYSIPLIFNGVEIPFKFGALPDDLEAAMLSGRTTAIIGADIFYHFILTFDYNQQRIYIK